MHTGNDNNDARQSPSRHLSGLDKRDDITPSGNFRELSLLIHCCYRSNWGIIFVISIC